MSGIPITSHSGAAIPASSFIEQRRLVAPKECNLLPGHCWAQEGGAGRLISGTSDTRCKGCGGKLLFNNSKRRSER